MNSITKVNCTIRQNLQSKLYPFIKNSFYNIRNRNAYSKVLSINNQRRNISSLLDQDPNLAQETFFAQHRPLLFNKVKFDVEIKTLKKNANVIEPAPFSTILPTKFSSYDEMGYLSGPSTPEAKAAATSSQVMAAWDILDCLFTGHTQNNTMDYDETTATTESTNTNTNANLQPPQVLKSISEDTYLSYFKTDDDILSQDDDMDIDILFSQLTKNSKLFDSSSSSSSTSSTSSSIPDDLHKTTSSTDSNILSKKELKTLNTTATTTITGTPTSSTSTPSTKASATPSTNSLSSVDSLKSSIISSSSSSPTAASASATSTKKSCISKSKMETLKK